MEVPNNSAKKIFLLAKKGFWDGLIELFSKAGGFFVACFFPAHSLFLQPRFQGRHRNVTGTSQEPATLFHSPLCLHICEQVSLCRIQPKNTTTQQQINIFIK